MAFLVNPDGTTEELTLPEEDRLDFMQECVGGYIEAISAGHLYSNKYTVVLVNEEGIMMGMEPNLVASKVIGRPIVGPALFLSDEEWD